MVNWLNRSSDVDSIVIERGSSSKSLGIVGTVSANVNSFTDTTIDVNKTFYYRVTAVKSDSTVLMSYQQKIKSEQTKTGFSWLENDLISVFPNPVKNILKVQNSTGKVIKNIVIYDLNGAIVLEKNGGKEKLIQIATDGLLKQSYILEINTENDSFRRTFVKN